MVAWGTYVKTTFDFAVKAALEMVKDHNSTSCTQAQVEEWFKKQHLLPLQKETLALSFGIAMQAPSSQNKWVGWESTFLFLVPRHSPRLTASLLEEETEEVQAPCLETSGDAPHKFSVSSEEQHGSLERVARRQRRFIASEH